MGLPIVPSNPKIATSRASRWRAGVLVLVHLLIAAHITHWLVTGNTITPVEPSEAMAFTKAGMINAGVIFFAATALLTLVFGRFFCGWACHLVALQDLCRSLLLRLGIRPRPLRSRLLAWVPALAFFYMFLWPLVYRIWIRDDLGRLGTEFTTEHFWATFPGWVVGALTFLVCGFVVVYFLGAKGFCTYACPYGALFSAAERLAPFRIRVTDACAGCGHCTAVCSSNVRVHEEVRSYGMVVDSGCMKCLDCVSVCPNDALYYGWGPIPWSTKPRQEPRTRSPRFTVAEEVVLATAFAVTFFSVRGLYGSFPFLLSLGLAGVVGYLFTVAWQVWRRSNVSLHGRRLKVRNQLQPAGRALLALVGGLTLVVLASAVVQTSERLGDHATRHLRAAYRDSLGVIEEPRRLTREEQSAARRARDHFLRARKWGLAPTPGLARKIAWTTFLVGPLDELQRSATQALARGEAPVEMHELLAHDAWSRQDHATALHHYEAARAVAPGQGRLALHLGVVAARAGKLERASQVLSQATVDFPNSVDILYNAGVVEALRSQPEEAVAYFERVLALDDSRRDARENLAGMLAAAGRFEESIGHYERALADAPEDTETRVLLVRAQLLAGRSAEAEANLDTLAEMAPGHPGLGLLRAMLAESSASAPL